MSANTLGIIGLGLLGSALAERALSTGYSVVGFDPRESQRQWLADQPGGIAVDSNQQVAARCPWILLVLPHEGIAREVVDSIRSELSAESCIVDVTTGDPDVMRAMGDSLARIGVAYADATLSGSSEQARRGEAVFMVGCDRPYFERLQPLLAKLAQRVLHVGQCGDGAKMKLITNLVLGLNRAALAEGLVLAQRLGLSLSDSLAALRTSMAYSKIMDGKGEKMIGGDFRPQARLSQHLKDVRLMLAAAQRTGQSLPLTEAHRAVLEHAESLGLGELDNSAVFAAIMQWTQGDSI